MAFYVNWSKTLPYSIKTIMGDTKNIGAIYNLSFKNTERKHTVFYVGQSNELQATLLDHLEENDPCIKKILNEKECYFRFAYLKNQGDRDCSERFLYDHYNPQCNHTIPAGEPCTINVD